MAFNPFKAIHRAFTLPRRYNSLSDVARDPVGAIGNTASWALPLAVGLPGGLSSLPKLLSDPSLIGKWSLGNIAKSAGGSMSLGNLGKLFSAKNLPLLIGGYYLLQQNRRAGDLERQLSQQADVYRQLFEESRPLSSALNLMRLSALSSLPTPDSYEARARAEVEKLLNALENRERAAGIRTLSSERRRAIALANVAQASANYPLEYVRMLFGLPSSMGMAPLGMQTNLLGQQYAAQQSQLASLAQALAYLMPYWYERGGA
jgi:hypothetical protein